MLDHKLLCSQPEKKIFLSQNLEKVIKLTYVIINSSNINASSVIVIRVRLKMYFLVYDFKNKVTNSYCCCMLVSGGEREG